MFELMGVPSEMISRFLARVKNAYKTSGPKGFWRAMAETLSAVVPPIARYKPPSAVSAGFWAQAGETDKAIAQLEKAYEERDEGVLRLKAHIYDPIKP